MKLYLVSLILLLSCLPCCKIKEQKIPEATSVDNSRIATYHTVATQLALLSNQAIMQLLEKGTTTHEGVGGGTVGVLVIAGTPVFFKKVNLTDLEKQPENIMSTRNLFKLPLYYQYSMGSAGFGVWRELFCAILATNWVLTGACPNFPLMYHWRVLPQKVPQPTADELLSLEKRVAWWQGSQAVRARLEAIQQSSAYVVLFLEYIPYTLATWLEKRFAKGDASAQEALAMVVRDINTTISFMQAHGLLHFDADFKNILTDGNRLYFTDFGLSICSEFELSAAEYDFFKMHHNFDRYFTMSKLVTHVIRMLFKSEKMREAVLQEYAVGKGNSIERQWAAAIITRYAPIAVVMLDFWKEFRINKKTPFPRSKLEEADKKGQKALNYFDAKFT